MIHTFGFWTTKMFYKLNETSWIIHQRLPCKLPTFSDLWKEKPLEKEKIKMFGKTINAPRYSKAYLTDYEFSGLNHSASKELPIGVDEIFEFCKNNISDKFNGVLINWYEPDSYIGFHSDDEKRLIPGIPIITITLLENEREPRKFLIKSSTDVTSQFFLKHGDILVMGGNCQKTYKHAVPMSKKYKHRRISITIRAFK